MKKPPFNTNYPKPVEKVHVPNKIETDVEGFEKENFNGTLEEFYKLIPNPRVKVGIDFIDDIFKEGVNKKDVAKVFGKKLIDGLVKGGVPRKYLENTDPI